MVLIAVRTGQYLAVKRRSADYQACPNPIGQTQPRNTQPKSQKNASILLIPTHHMAVQPCFSKASLSPQRHIGTIGSLMESQIWPMLCSFSRKQRSLCPPPTASLRRRESLPYLDIRSAPRFSEAAALRYVYFLFLERLHICIVCKLSGCDSCE